MTPIVFVVGARPNFVKVSPILRVLADRVTPFSVRLVHTGQHYDHDMSLVFLRELAMPAPDVDLAVGSGTHGAQTAMALERFEGYLLSPSPLPRGVVVVGDVNSSLACALAAVKLGIAVAHVEAGLRSFDRTMPEEINRILIDAVADLLLVSEPSGELNLRREGVAPERIRFVGNVMIDTLERELAAARALDMPGRMQLPEAGYAVVTLHRSSNVDLPERLAALVDLISWLGTRLPVIFPIHPRTRQQLERLSLMDRLARHAAIRLLEPVSYRESIGLIASARMVLTDSGGIQEETSYLGVPCLTLRPNTERPITVTQGTNTLVGDDLRRARHLVDGILNGPPSRRPVIAGWDGHSADRVVDALVEAWGR